ncbi:MAG: hypothetical protein A4E19_07915 [Nitrospira sp. SG-bin1]|nr:MAG: hypothetical protein A4E19_07915 [Nitrospira sp. SG-bin1]
MALSQSRDRTSLRQSAADLSLTQVTLEALLMPHHRKAEAEQSRMARDERREDLDDDPLGPARGIINGLRLSATLWSVIALMVLLMR